MRALIGRLRLRTCLHPVRKVDGLLLFDVCTLRVWQVMVPPCGRGTEAAKLIPVERVGARGELDARKFRVGQKDEGLRSEVAQSRVCALTDQGLELIL
jgi:hypothetical protein